MEIKPGYKQTEVGVIPEDWDVKPLGEIGGVRMCKRIFKHQTREVGTVPFYKIGTFGSTPDAFISQALFDEYKSKYSFPKKGDVLISAAGTIGRTVAYNGEPAYFQDSNIVWIENDQTKALNEYLWHYYKTVKWAVSDGGTVARLYNDNLKNKIFIAYPPNDGEQRAIAAALADVDGLIESLERLIAKKRDLKQAAMQQLLTGLKRLPGFKGGWADRTLGEIGECIIGLTYKPENVVEHGLLVLRASNIQNGRLTYDDNVSVNIEVPDRLIVRLGDILICVRNGSRALIGKCAVIDETAAGVTFGAFMSVYRTRHWRFIHHAFQSHSMQRQIHENIGATINQITNKDLNSFRIMLPSEPEQTAIATVLSDMDAEIAALEGRRDKTRLLKQGMMQELLTGKTRLV